VDYAHVRAVIHMGPPRDMISFAQETGRLGRDGNGGTSRIILPYGWQAPTTDRGVGEGLLRLPEVAMGLYLGPCRCLAAVLSRFQDGREHIRYCSGNTSGFRCSLCIRSGPVLQAEQDDVTVYWDGTVSSGSKAQGEEEKKGQTEEEEDDEDNEEDKQVVALSQGQGRLRLHRRDEEQGRDRFVQRLRGLQGRCMICSLLGTVVSDGSEWHDMKSCRRREKWEFFRAKREAKKRGEQRGKGWVGQFIACFWCGNPQEVCERAGGAEGQCEFPDVIYPAA
jgi:hypothetical protein